MVCLTRWVTWPRSQSWIVISITEIVNGQLRSNYHCETSDLKKPVRVIFNTIWKRKGTWMRKTGAGIFPGNSMIMFDPLHITLLVIFSVIVQLNAEDQLLFSMYETLCGDVLCSTDPPNMTISSDSPGNCAMRCVQVPGCRAFNWRNFGECQMYFYKSSSKNFNSVNGCRHFIGEYI